MPGELLAGNSQIDLVAFNAQGSEQLRPGIAGEIFQLATRCTGAFEICNVSNWYSCGNDAKPLVEGSKLAQEGLQSRVTESPFL
jgi:hypothetical protein